MKRSELKQIIREVIEEGFFSKPKYLAFKDFAKTVTGDERFNGYLGKSIIKKQFGSGATIDSLYSVLRSIFIHDTYSSKYKSGFYKIESKEQQINYAANYMNELWPEIPKDVWFDVITINKNEDSI